MSPLEQRETIEAWAARGGHVIAAWHDETDSVSGATVDREGLGAAMGRALAGKTDGIVVAKVDRFARTLTGGLTAVGQLREANKTFVAVKDGIEGEHATTFQGRLFLTILFLFAEWTLETLRDGWESTRRRHIANGVPNHAKYGYRKDPESRRLVPDPDEAPWVTAMLERRRDGWTWERLADWLNDVGAPTRDGGGWAVSSVRQIVQSRVYLGEIRSGEIVNEAAHEPLVSLELWQRANSVNKTPQRREAGQFVLSGLVRCAGCGVRMAGRADHVTAAGGQEVEYRYYTCRRRQSFGRCPAPARVKADEVEVIVGAEFHHKFVTGWKGRPSVSTEELDAALAAQAEAEAELHAFLTSSSTAEMRRALGDEWVEEGQRARLNRVVEAREAVVEARNAMMGVALPANLAEEWPTMDVEDQRGFLADGFEVVAVARGRGPAAERTRIWTRTDPGCPRNLPGVGSDVDAITPIPVAAGDAPVGAGAGAIR